MGGVEKTLEIRLRPLRAQQTVVQLQVPRNQLTLVKMVLSLILTLFTSLQEALSSFISIQAITQLFRPLLITHAIQ